MNANLKAYEVTFTTPAKLHGKTVHTWTRFAESEEQAREDAARALHLEYYGRAELVSVKLSDVKGMK